MENYKVMTEENQSPAEESETRKQGFFTRLTINVLKGIITRLQSTVDQLESASVTETDQSQPAIEELRGWDKILRQIKNKVTLLEPLPDWLLTTILVGGSVAIVWGAVAIVPEDLFQETVPPTEVSQQPETSEKPEPPIPLPEETIEPETPPQPEPEPETPEPELTPEQGLIAAIQEQVSEITTRYAEGLIASLEANFRDGRLIIAVNEEWFNLSADRQDELSKEMLARSRKLDFTKLVLTTPDGKLLARSPVVGEKMVILQRTNPSSPEKPA